MAELLGSAEDALSNDQIIRQFDGALTQAIKSTAEPTYDFERQVLIAQARLQFQMIRGQQNNVLGWGSNDYGGQQIDWVPFDDSAGQEETGADVKLCPPVNFIGGDCFKFMAIMGSSSPRVKGVADDLRSPEDIAAAKCADTNIRNLWTKNKIDRQWKIPAFHVYATGPCFIRGFWNTDAVKYGQTIEPKIEISIGPDGMPMPEVVGEQAYANGDAELSFHSVLEVSIPWEARELRGNPLKLERMVSKWSLLAKYPGKDGQPGPLDQYRGGDVPDDEMNGASVAAQEARTATSTPSGTAKSKPINNWRFTEWWIPTYLFEAIDNSKARDVIKRQFQRGLYIARVGSVTVEIDDREVTDEWTVVTVNRGDKIMDRPVCADNVPLQRAINDLYGMSIETILRAITQTIIDNQLIDRQAMSTKEAVPAEVILTALPVDGDINKRIFQIPPAHLSDQAIPLIGNFRAAGQDISGVRPELSGGGAPAQTFREAKQRKDQALAQLAPQAQAMRDAAEDIARILVTLRSKYGSGTVKAQNKGAYGIETSVADIADLKEEGWHPESDDQFPLTLSDKRDAVYSLLKENPEVAAALGMMDPMNIEQVIELLGVPGFESAIADQKVKTLANIDALLQGQPIPGEPSPDGQPGDPQPSIPPDAFDDAGLVTSIMSKWLVGPVGQQHVGTPGFENVKASWAAYKQMSQPPMPAPPPPMKGSMSVSLKAEDVPSMIPDLLKATGMTVTPPPAPSAPPPAGPPPPMPGGPPPQASPLPPMPPGAGAPPPPMPGGPPPQASPLPPMPPGAGAPPPPMG